MTLQEIVVAVLLSLISLVVGALVNRYYASRRKISIVVPSLFNLVDLSRVAADKVQILYANKPIESLWVIRIVVQNSGNADITEEMVQILPRVSFGEATSIIDVEPTHTSSESDAEALVVDNRLVDIKINYLRRGRESAFQILAHAARGSAIDPNDIRIEQGLIENADLGIYNFLTAAVPSVLQQPYKILRKQRKLVARVYIVLSSLLVVFGVTSILASGIRGWPEEVATTPLLEGIVQLILPKRPLVGVLLIFYGFLLIVPSVYLLRRQHYLELFARDDHS